MNLRTAQEKETELQHKVERYRARCDAKQKELAAVSQELACVRQELKCACQELQHVHQELKKSLESAQAQEAALMLKIEGYRIALEEKNSTGDNADNEGKLRKELEILKVRHLSVFPILLTLLLGGACPCDHREEQRFGSDASEIFAKIAESQRAGAMTFLCETPGTHTPILRIEKLNCKANLFQCRLRRHDGAEVPHPQASRVKIKPQCHPQKGHCQVCSIPSMLRQCSPSLAALVPQHLKRGHPHPCNTFVKQERSEMPSCKGFAVK